MSNTENENLNENTSETTSTSNAIYKVNDSFLSKLGTAILNNIDNKINQITITFNDVPIAINNKNFDINFTTSKFAISSQYNFNPYFKGQIDVSDQEDNLNNYLYNHFALGNYSTNTVDCAISNKGVTLEVGELDWEQDETYLTEILGESKYISDLYVKLTFPDSSSIERTINVFKITRGNCKLVAVKTNNGAYIDTGIVANTKYTLKATGRTYDNSNQAVFIGAYVSNSSRYTMRFLPTSGKLQHMCPTNNEIAFSNIDVNFKPYETFSYVQTQTSLRITQGDINYTKSVTTSSTLVNISTNFLLFNETTNGAYYNAIINSAEIHDQYGNILGIFEPYYIDSEIVFLNTKKVREYNVYDYDNPIWDDEIEDYTYPLTFDALDDILENGVNSDYYILNETVFKTPKGYFSII